MIVVNEKGAKGPEENVSAEKGERGMGKVVRGRKNFLSLNVLWSCFGGVHGFPIRTGSTPKTNAVPYY